MLGVGSAAATKHRGHGRGTEYPRVDVRPEPNVPA